MRISILAVSILLSLSAVAGGRHAPVHPAPSPTPSASPSPAPIHPYAPFTTIGPDTGSNVDRVMAQEALDLMSEAVGSGCLKSKVDNHGFTSFNAVVLPLVQSSEEVYERYVAGAPYALDLHWYLKRLSKTIGYTYNWRSDTGGQAGVSETRIWTNTKFISSAEMLAAHWAHELSHEARAGGFVHYTVFTGSVPYDLGDLMAICIKERNYAWLFQLRPTPTASPAALRFAMF